LPVAIIKKTKAAIKKAESEAELTLIAAAQPAAMASNALMVEDEFNPFYMTGANSNSGHLLRPPYDPRQLEKLTQENNAIGACIDAMVINIDGTGFKIEKENPDAEDVDEEEDPEAKALEDFFKEPFPGVSFMTMRRELRRDMERIGYGFPEVMRNVNGDIFLLRNLPARTIRLVKLGMKGLAENQLDFSFRCPVVFPTKCRSLRRERSFSVNGLEVPY
jgi:capsid portal protein